MRTTTKAKLIGALRTLNRHYGLEVRFRTGARRTGPALTAGDVSPWADALRATISFPPEPILYCKQVLAHEYAHILDLPRVADDIHDAQFERIYQGVCQVLGVHAVPTGALRATFRKKLEAMLDARYSGGDV